METISLNIFKIKDDYDNKRVNEKIQKKFSDNKVTYIESENEIIDSLGKFNFHFYFGSKQSENCKIDWYEKMRNIFNDLEVKNKSIFSAYGVLVIDGELKKVNTENGKIELDKKIEYAITFGHGNSIVSNIVDYNYGLAMASKMAKESSIIAQSSKYYSMNKDKALTVYKNVNFSTEVGEAVDLLTAEIEEYPGHSSVKQLLEVINKNIAFSTYLRISLIKEFSIENIISIIRNLNNIYYKYPNDRIIIPRLFYLTKKDEEIIKRLNEKLKEEALKNKEDINFSFGMYNNIEGSIIITDSIETFTLSCNRKKKDYSELSIENVKEFMQENDIEDITKISLETDSTTKRKLCDYIDYTTQLDNDESTYYCLFSGRWAKFNKEYIQKVESDIKNRIEKITEYREDYGIEDLEVLREKYSRELIGKEYDKSDSMRRSLYRERIYNCDLSHKMNAELLDRDTEQTNGIEIADLYTRDTHELVHVKIGDPGVFMECINQSAKGAHYYTHHKDYINKKSKGRIGKVEKITMLLVTRNQKVWNKRDISKFNSLRFKLNLLQWAKEIDDLNFDKRIIIVKE